MLRIDRKGGEIIDGEGNRFDPLRRTWVARSGSDDGDPIGLVDAVAWLQKQNKVRFRAPVGVIGPRDATAEQVAAAEEIGARLADMGLSIVCGGRQGIMEAVCRGSAGRGGISVGLLPETDPSLANPYVTVPIATGIGEARNALVARAAFCLVVIGNSYGTLSEVALGLQFGKTVIGMSGAADVPGVRHCSKTETVIMMVARAVLALPEEDGSPG